MHSPADNLKRGIAKMEPYAGDEKSLSDNKRYKIFQTKASPQYIYLPSVPGEVANEVTVTTTPEDPVQQSSQPTAIILPQSSPAFIGQASPAIPQSATPLYISSTLPKATPQSTVRSTPKLVTVNLPSPTAANIPPKATPVKKTPEKKLKNGTSSFQQRLNQLNNSTVTNNNNSPVPAKANVTLDRNWKYTTVASSPVLTRPPLHSTVTITPVTSPAIQSSSIKLVPFALCPNCGGGSSNLLVCTNCKKALPSNPKITSPVPCQRLGNVCLPINQASPTTSAVTIPKQTFYGIKLQNQGEAYNRTTSLTMLKKVCVPVAAEAKPPVKKTVNRKKKEPECLTLSSDEENSENDNKEGSHSKEHFEKRLQFMRDKLGNVIPTPPKKPMKQDPEPLDEPSDLLVLQLRSLRIGSFKIMPVKPVSIENGSFTFHVPTVAKDGDFVKIILKPEDILLTMSFFDESFSAIFVYTTAGSAAAIRNRLKMSKKGPVYFDPNAEDETIKRITLLPEFPPEEQRTKFRTMFPPDKLKEINQATANEILVRSAPNNSAVVSGEDSQASSSAQVSNVVITRAQSMKKEPPLENITLLTYPPAQAGGITVTTNDVDCLEEGEFLNDIIIDFYLKYLADSVISEDRKKRIHLFSSFFYPRLTTNPTAKNEPVNLPLEIRKHSRVKTWTRHVDIFEKDYIVIPINQSSHWFVAVVCFPGHVPDAEFANENKSLNESNILRNELSQENKSVTDKNTSVTANNNSLSQELHPWNAYPDSEDEKSNSQDTTSDQAIPPTPSESQESSSKNSGPAHEPCIVIFDSLTGPARWRIVSNIREYLQVEWKQRKGTVKVFNRDTMRGYTPLVPQQSNYTDCGVYCLHYIETLLTEEVMQVFKSPPPDLSNWFTTETVSGKRQAIKKLILDLSEQYSKSKDTKKSE